ncbi:2-oxo acid dehydrogenase subunit E2 [Thiohalocapsa marina]|uniref:Dihydrolipoamide acetyltransferase component of pyruvate dehydrogenase complex n=1 Tax=Thiohalocapsa marina TaxID=424902 RepID=A0A5M8FSU5_9GAMM|nr:dihydrolipoamide acetyltransferase family protein [Thiohalocapsa marina]KAA6186002.1 2-oxo acid dehydrogenase subunit E2 [Thiohalocapsa marina]
MSRLYRMPSLGSDMEAGTLIEWVRQPGDRLAKGDVIAVIETQKGAIEVEVFHDAVMGRPLIQVGDKVPVGSPMAELEDASAAPALRPATGIPATHAPEPGPAVAEAGTRTSERIADQAGHRIGHRAGTGTAAQRRRASPAARRLADARGIALDAIEGSGPRGAVVLADVHAATGTTPTTEAASPPRGHLDLAAMRQAIAAAMSRSKREIPHYYLSHDIDLTAATDWLTARNAQLPPDQRLLLGALLIKAVALSLDKFPELNGFDRDGHFEPAQGVHIGCATAIRGGGLVAPALHDADQLQLPTLMTRLRDLVGRVRSGGLRASELSDPTITVSSLGERGVDRLYGIIYPPQVAIVGFGTPALRPWVQDGQVVPRNIVTATLSADHRHSDGHRGALFLARVGQRLQEPDTL